MADKTSASDGAGGLLELLRRAGREEPGSVGFGRAQQPARRRAPLVLLAATAADPARLAAAREGGADAGLVTLGGEGEAPTSPAGEGAWPLAGLPLAARPVAPADLDRWQAKGLDALVLRPREAQAACFSPRRRGLFALLDHSLPVEGLRAAATLPVDGFFLEDAGGEGPLSGDDLLWLGLALGLLRAPAILLSRRVAVADLEALVGVGLAGVAVHTADDAAAEAVRGSMAEFRAAIDAIDPHLREQAREHAGRTPVVIPFRAPQG